MGLSKEAKVALKSTSRTFYIPISRLPNGLQEAVGNAYLCMRAIDEVEDHHDLDKQTKAHLLHGISNILQAQADDNAYAVRELNHLFHPYADLLPQVTRQLGLWICQAPASVAPRIWDATATMADRMASWALRNWRIHTEADLDRYTFSVAGAVGLLICDIGAWFDGSQMHRAAAVQFGRGLQSVNILRNRQEDLTRGIDFFPVGWTFEDMEAYARRNLSLAQEYANTLPKQPFTYFIRIPLVLASATLDALARGETKLSRTAVLKLVQSA